MQERASSSGNNLLLALLSAAQVTISMDFSLASVALPAMERGLNIGPSLSQWVLTGDLLAYGGFLIVGGRLSDAYGQKRTLFLGLLLFSLGALGTSLSDALGELVFCRALQGLGGALAYPATVALLTINFRPGPERYRALTVSMVSQAVGVPLGTMVAGYLVTRWGWHSAFLLDVPLCIGLILLLPVVLPKWKRVSEEKINIPVAAAFLLAIGSAFAIHGAISSVSTNPNTLALAPYTLTTGVVLLGIFIAWQSVSKTPMVPRHLLRTRNLVAGTFISAFIVLVGKGLVVLANLSFQKGLHLSAREASLHLYPMAVGSLLVIPVARWLTPFLVRSPKAALIGAFIVAMTFNSILSVMPLEYAFIGLSCILFLAPFAALNGTNVGIAETLHDVMPQDQGVAGAILYTAVQVIGAVGMSLIIVASGQSEMAANDFAKFAPSFRLAAEICVFGIFLTALTLRPHRTVAQSPPLADAAVNKAPGE